MSMPAAKFTVAVYADRRRLKIPLCLDFRRLVARKPSKLCVARRSLGTSAVELTAETQRSAEN
jgi:hypothetical protein